MTEVTRLRKPELAKRYVAACVATTISNDLTQGAAQPHLRLGFFARQASAIL